MQSAMNNVKSTTQPQLLDKKIDYLIYMYKYNEMKVEEGEHNILNGKDKSHGVTIYDGLNKINLTEYEKRNQKCIQI